MSLVAGLTICLSLHSHSQDGATALFVASQDGHTSTVDVLLRNGADPNIADNVSASVVNFGNVKQRQVRLCKRIYVVYCDPCMYCHGLLLSHLL